MRVRWGDDQRRARKPIFGPVYRIDPKSDVNSMNCLKRATILFLSLNALACSTSSYLIHSNPSGASVFYMDQKSQGKQLLGLTPLNYSKSSLPEAEPFVLSFEKEGYLPQQVPIAPTNDSRTTVSTTLKVEPSLAKQPNLEMNKVINRLFRAQEMIYRKRIQSAIVELDQIIQEKPDIVQAHVMRGTCYYILNEMPSAIEAWKTALQLDPDNKELVRFLQEKNVVIQK